MEKYLNEDGTYKFVYKLPSNTVLEFDFSFKKGENYGTIMKENFEQEKIPKILLPEIDILMQQFLFEERRGKKFFTRTLKEKLHSKVFSQSVINQWLSIKTFKNHIERM